jgi:hypothetical protein
MGIETISNGKALTKIQSDFANFRDSQKLRDAIGQNDFKGVSRVLNTSMRSGVYLDESAVVYAGKSAIRYASTSVTHDQKAVNAILASLDYRSFLNSRALRTITRIEPFTEQTHYEFWSASPNPPHFYAIGHATAPNLPVFERLGSSLNRAVQSGPEFLLFKGGEVTLDLMDIKNVVIQDAIVTYVGAQVRLEGVYFINCKFHIFDIVDVKDLVTAILEQPIVTFARS